MFFKIAIVAAFVAVAQGVAVSLLGGLGLDHGLLSTGNIYSSPAIAIAKQPVADIHTPANYQFNYAVNDAHTGDNKQQSETRVGDTVNGEYSLAEPDGTIRVVKYTADPHNGFNAVVSRVGHAAHPQLVQRTVVTSPVISHGIGLGLAFH